jgi:hypothetical protein
MRGKNRYLEIKAHTLASTFLDQIKKENDFAIDVLIPVIRKDWVVLPSVIQGVRRNLRNRLRKIFIVGPEQPTSIAFSENVVFRDERTVLPITKKDIDYSPGGSDRSGWLFQQFIKLSCDAICESDYFLLLDADTVLLRPQRFVQDDGRMVLNISDERHEEYYKAIRLLLPGLPIFPYSFVSHHMLVNRKIVGELKSLLEASGVVWYQFILNKVDLHEPSCFSEYELYGNFSLERYPDLFDLQHFLNIGYAQERISTLNLIRYRHPFRKSASFHNQ